jgi:DNA-binding CsgD family transcriptional regulator
MLLTDAGGRVTWANAAASGAFGNVVGRHFSIFVAPERVNDERELFARKIIGGQDETIHETMLVVGGERLDAEIASVPVHDDGAVSGILFLVRPASRPAERTACEPRPRLTPRQHQVLELLAAGASTRRIAAELQIAEETARNHIRLLLAELRVHTRLEAVVAAFRNGWI